MDRVLDGDLDALIHAFLVLRKTGKTAATTKMRPARLSESCGHRSARASWSRFPTETVYGLGANALDAAAVARIFELKGRPATSPLIVHVASVEMAREIVAEWPPRAEELAREYWPGPLTWCCPKQPRAFPIS